MGSTKEARHRPSELRELEVQIAFERMVSALSSELVHASPRVPGRIDGVITNALKRIGEFFAIERDFVFLFSEDGRTMDNTHEWAADGVEPQADGLQNIPIDRYSWALERLRSGTPLVVDDVQDLPPEADAEKEKLIEQKVQSILAVPLVCDGRVIGYMGLHSVGRKMHWSEQTVGLVTVISEIVAGAVTRDRVERELRESEARYRRLHEEKELLLREVYHRIRNNMATMQNLLEFRAQRLDESPAAPILRAAAAQIQSMQSLYRRLHYTTDMREIDLASYLSEVVGAVAAMAPDHVVVDTDLASHAMPVGPGLAFSVGIIANELLTNGFKYAFPDGCAGGVIKIGLACDGDNRCRLTYTDNGVGMPSGDALLSARSSQGGFGSIMIRTLVEQMSGTIDGTTGRPGDAVSGEAPNSHAEGDGTEIHIVFPVSPSDE